MPVAKVSSRGQVTLPVSVRNGLDIERGDELLIDVDEGSKTASFRVIKKKPLSQFYGALKVKGKWVGKDQEMAAAGKYLSARTERSFREGKRK